MNFNICMRVRMLSADASRTALDRHGAGFSVRFRAHDELHSFRQMSITRSQEDLRATIVPARS